jgi:hypothetical protein
MLKVTALIKDLADRRRPGLFFVESSVQPVYIVMAIPLSLVGLAAVLAVIRADAKDLPAIVRALFGRPGEDDRGDDPPSLPGSAL